MDAVSLDPPKSARSAGEHTGTSGVGRVAPVEVDTLAWRTASGEWLLTVVCKATFDLSPPVMRVSGYQMPVARNDERHGEADRLVAASDLDPLKKRVDVTVIGHCFAPERRRVSSLITRLKVGAIDKRIEVVGKRTWKGGELTNGEPFERLNMGYENAAGGPNTSNPAGISATSNRVPMLQPPGGGPKRPGDRVAPIGFGPIAPGWPQRRAMLRRNPEWSTASLDEAPLPSDVDERFFNSAPADQQLDEILPDEALLLENLHPRYPRLETRLPGLAPHAVVERPGAEPSPLSMRLDTLWIDTDRSLCVVLWRTHVPIESPAERGTVLVALGRAKEPPSLEDFRRAEPSPSRSRSRSVPPPPPRHRPPPSETAAVEGDDDDGDLFANTQTLSGKAADEAEFASTAEVPVAGGTARRAASRRPPPPPPRESIRDDPTEPPPPASARPEPLEPPPAPNELTMTDGLGEGTDVLDASPAWLSRVNEAGGVATPPPIQPPPSRSDAMSGLPFAPSSAGGPPSSTRARAQAPAASAPHAPAPPTPAAPVAPSPVSAAVHAGAALASGMSQPTDVNRGYLDGAPRGASPLPGGAASPTQGQVQSAISPAEAPPPIRPVMPQPIGEVTELLWFDPAVAPRLRTRWAPLVDELEFSPEDPMHDLHSDDPQESRDHHNTFGVLTEADADDGPGIAEAMRGAVSDGGRFTPPLVLVAGMMRLPFSELEMLKATAESMAPLAPSDKKLKEVLDEVNELLATPLLKGGASVAVSLTRQLREQFEQSKRSRQIQNLDDAVERVLLEERRYQTRKVFGGTSYRSLVTVPGDSEPIPTYVPEEVGPTLPLSNEMQIRAIAEAHMRQDRDEKRKIALRVLALGRVNRLD